MNADGPAGASSRRLRLAARILAFAWAVFWSGFGLLSGIGEGGGAVAILVHTAIPGLAFLAAAAIAWRWQRAGGLLLALAGLATLPVYGFARSVPGFLALALPGIAAGAMLWADWFRRRGGN
jgi:hypothetical protein